MPAGTDHGGCSRQRFGSACRKTASNDIATPSPSTAICLRALSGGRKRAAAAGLRSDI
jgi:hypothetical protein